MSVTKKAIRTSGSRSAKTRTVLGIKWCRDSRDIWEYKGWACQKYEGDGWTLYSPTGEMHCVGSLKSASRLVLSQTSS